MTSGIKWISIVLIVVAFAACKKVFNPPGTLTDSKKYLVIDGALNNGDTTLIKLSRTKIFANTVVLDTEKNAQVTVEGNDNTSYPLLELKPGNYSSLFTLNTTSKYRLRIKTTDSKEYLSDFVPVKNAPPVDSVGFTAQTDGVHIYANAHDDSKSTVYYRWEYIEDWQFHSWFESYTRGDQPRWQCYAKNVSGAIIIASTAKLSSDVVYQQPIAFIAGTSEKIETKYTILVKQYALTSDAYSFWTNLQKNTDRLGTIFDAQPSTNQTNYTCVTNPTEVVIGYLSAGSVSTRRIFITANQLPPTYSVPNTLGCKLDSAFFYHAPFYTDPQVVGGTSGKSTVEAFYVVPLGPLGAPNFFTITEDICDDCTLRGGLNPPPYWK